MYIPNNNVDNYSTNFAKAAAVRNLFNFHCAVHSLCDLCSFQSALDSVKLLLSHSHPPHHSQRIFIHSSLSRAIFSIFQVTIKKAFPMTEIVTLFLDDEKFMKIFLRLYFINFLTPFFSMGKFNLNIYV